MSASDLVPRVVLFVSDLERENDELKAQLQEQGDERLLVQITGPNRTPIHCEGSMKNGYSYGVGGHKWRLSIFENKNNDVVRLPLSSFTALEIWLDGIFIGNFQDVKTLDMFRFSPGGHGVSGSGMGMGTIYFKPEGITRRGRGPVDVITANIGPMTYADYTKWTDEQLNLEEQLASHDDLNVMIDSIIFHKDKIRGSMSLLEKLGIPSSYENDDGGDDGDDYDGDDDTAERVIMV